MEKVNRKKVGGGLFDTLFGITTQQPRDTSDLLNKILKWMLEKSSLLDFYALASPDECKQYVMFTAGNLDKLFNKINVKPVQAADGSISFSWAFQPTAAPVAGNSQVYFRSIKDLKDRKGDYAVQQQLLCNEIAFFYIRILQVFAALSLSVLDTKIPTDKELEVVMNIKGREISTGPSIPVGFQQTGGHTIMNPNFKVLNEYLVKSWDGRAYELTEYVDRGNSHVFIRKEDLEKLDRVQGNNELRISYIGKEKRATAILTLRREDDEQYQLGLANIILNDTSIDPIGPLLFRGYEPVHNNQTIPRFLKNTFGRLAGDPSSSMGEAKQKQEYIDKVQKLSKIPDQLKMPGIWKSIARTPPIKAYCVARALQLLSPNTLGEFPNSGKVKTSICNTSFSLIQTGSLPKPGQNVFETPGLLALNLLFYDEILGATPQINDPTQYKNFIDYLRVLYTEQGGSNTNTIIKDTTPDYLCTGKSGPLSIDDPRIRRTLQDGALSLIDRQVRHTAAVTLLIQKLFYIGDKGEIYFHPDIQKGGLEKVNAIAKEARDLLIEYYKDCEKGYRKAVYDVAVAKKEGSKINSQ